MNEVEALDTEQTAVAVPDSLKGYVLANSESLKILAKRMQDVRLVPPNGIPALEWIAQDRPRDNDDVRIQLLYMLRDHALTLEHEYRESQKVTHPKGKKAKDDGDRREQIDDFIRISRYRTDLMRNWQSAIRILYEHANTICENDVRVHMEARHTVAMMVQTALRERELAKKAEEEKERAEERKKDSDPKDVRDLLNRLGAGT